MDEGQSIDEAWQSLSSIARKTVSISPQFKEIKTEERKIQQLLAALPDSFSTIRDGIDLRQDLSPQDILGILREKQEQTTNQETAMFARKRSQARSDKKPLCFLYEGEHWIKECPGLDKAKKAVNDKTTKRQSPTRNRRGSSSAIKELKEIVKKMDLRIQSLEKRSRKPTSKKAYAAQEEESSASTSESTPSEGEDIDEVAHSTVEAKGKYKPFEWLLDSCASAHITDQESLFRELKPLETKKWIKVGGGYLVATHVGSAVMGGRKGKQIVLRGVLLVPGLGVNLVSWNQFSKQFGVQPPQFTLHSPDGKPVVQTRLSGGVPFIEEISQDLDERAYLCMSQDPINKDDYALAAQTAQTDQEQWELWHRRVGHFGEGLLKDLHQVTDLKERIPIPSKHQPCRVCSLAKMKKHRGKETERRPLRLSLVSIDICGPLPISRLGFKWWLEIVDNYSRKKWVSPLKSRGDAAGALQDWKKKAELQSGNKLQAVRSDGARELLSLLKQ